MLPLKCILLSILTTTQALSLGKQFQIPATNEQASKPKLQGPVTVNLNGTEYKLDTDVCSGGVMLKKRMPVLSFCGVGVFGLSRKGCSKENEMYVGLKEAYTCDSFPGGVQRIGVVDFGEGTTEGTSEGTSTEGTTELTSTERTSTQSTSTDQTTTEPSTLSYLDVTAPVDLAFEHNNLIEKRGVKPSDGFGTTETVRKRGALDEEDAVDVEVDEGDKGASDEDSVPDVVGVEEDEDLVVGKRESKGKTTDKVTTKPTGTTGKPTGKPATGPTTEPPESGEPEDSEVQGEPDTVSIEEDTEPEPETLAGRSGKSNEVVRPYNVKPVNFPIENVEESDKNETSGSAEDTVAIRDRPAGADSPLLGRSDVGGGALEGAEGISLGFGDEVEHVEFSSEVDERGGGWEEGGGVPEVGTVEYDALTGGVDKWVKMPLPSAEFDAHLTLIRKQIEFEIVHWGVHVDETRPPGGPTFPHESVIGIKDLPNNATWLRFLAFCAGTASTLVPDELFRDSFSVPGAKLVKGYQNVPPPAHNFFSDVLFIFGYFARSYQGLGLSAEVGDLVMKGFEGCWAKADGFRKGVVVGGTGGCVEGVEVKSVTTNEPVWDEVGAVFEFKERVVNFSAGDELPPLHLRVNPSKWVFAELMWWAVQVSYMFCFDKFGDPNLFMVAFDSVLRVFESEVVKGVWENGGGRLEMFEQLLPYIKGDRGFRGLLNELDKVLEGVRVGSVVGGFGRGKRERGNRVRNSWDEVKRRKRDVGDGEKGNGVFSQTGWFSGGSSSSSTTETTTGTEASTTDSTSSISTTTTEPTTLRAVDKLEKFFESLKNFPTSRSVSTTTEVSSSTGSTQVTSESTTSIPATSVSSTTVSSTPPVTVTEVPGTLSQFEIWDGLAYCLVSDGGGGLSPSFKEFESVGVC